MWTAGKIVQALDGDRPLMVWGPPGIGKSASIFDAATAAGYLVIPVIGSNRMPEDFSGVPRVDEGGVTRFAPPGFAADANAHDGPVLLLLDELNTASPSVQAAMLRVIQERQVGDLALADHVRIVGLGNPPGLAGHIGRSLSAPMANRFVHCDFSFDVAGWMEWMTANHRGNAALGPVLGFLRSASHFLAPDPPADAASAGLAWPSPRSWDAAVALAGVMGKSDRQSVLMSAVGQGAAVAMVEWERKADLPATADVLADPSKVDWRARPDRVFAILASVAAHVGTQGGDVRMSAYRTIAYAAEHGSPDLVMFSLKQLLDSQPADSSIPFAALGGLRPLIDDLRTARSR